MMSINGKTRMKRFYAEQRLFERIKRDTAYSEEKIMEFKEWILFYRTKIRINDKFMKNIGKIKKEYSDFLNLQ